MNHFYCIEKQLKLKPDINKLIDKWGMKGLNLFLQNTYDPFNQLGCINNDLKAKENTNKK